MPDEEPDEDSIIEEVVEANGSSKASNGASSCTSISALAHGVPRGQVHIYHAGFEADERWHPNSLTQSFDNGQLNSMFSIVRSLTLS